MADRRNRCLLSFSWLLASLWLWPPAAPAAPPTHNPLAHLNLAWTDSVRWANVVDITQAGGADLAARLANAQAALAAKGGGVVYFPPGTYRFSDSILLKDGVVLRGADPAGATRARDEKYDPPAKIE
ncbi:MAG TPA: glycosyl hydrolase family 28-related protein, partial [Phycisphaerae bacterium]|nr:glycosyl hydrolase family 28-related protein [Phycisphaerae bacterium]